jgi:hypothetical protein
MITRRLTILLLAFALALLALADPSAEGRSDVDVPEEDRELHHRDELTPACAGVFTAHEILASLYPHRHAHLHKKLGGAAQTRRLPDELGWSSHVSRLRPSLLSSKPCTGS